MTPDAVAPDLALDASSAVKGHDPASEVDDELLACLIEHGIESVPMEHRAPLLRAIGNSPELAAVVADLARGAAADLSQAPIATVFGLRSRTWRASWAACALLAVGATAWHVADSGSSGVQLLDGGVDGPAQDFADSLHQTLRRSTVAILWASLVLLTIPAFLASPREQQRKPALEGRGPHH